MGTFLCSECGKSFTEEAYLYIHQTRVHDKTLLTCDTCGENCVGKVALQNHKRKHTAVAKPKLKTILKCEICAFETSNMANLRRHKGVHIEKPQKKKKPTECEECGKTFARKDSLDKHVKVHKKSEPVEACKECDYKGSGTADLKNHVNLVHQQVKKVKSTAGFGNFVRKEKTKALNQFMCSECSKTFNSNANLKRHMMSGLHATARRKKRRHRTTVMRKVKKMLSDPDFLKEISRQSKLGAPSGVIDETLVEAIMSQIPNISNRNILRTLTILRKKLPKQQFKANLRKVLQQRSNLLDDLFQTEFSSVVDAKGEEVMMPITSAKHLSTLVHIVCEKRGYNEDDVKIVIGVDGGQGKLIATLAIIPKDEKDKQGRMAEEQVKDRSKSTSVKRCLVIGRVDSVPENYENVKVLVEKINIPELRKDFCLVCDIKLIDIMVGIQSTSSIRPCPYCNGCKIDKFGRETNQKGKFIKGQPRSMKNLKEKYQAYTESGSDRKNIRNFDSVEHLPLYVHENQENMSVLELYPPPQLHCGILGPGNDVLTKLEKLFPQEMKAYYTQFHIKGSGPGGSFNGPTIKAILENRQGKLEKLSEIVSKHGKKYNVFIDHLENLGRLNIAVNMRVLDKELIAEIIENLRNVFEQMMEDFDMSMPLKIHIILEHYLEFFEAKNESLLSYTDEFCEAMHSQIRLFEESHRYLNNQKGSDSHAKMQHKSTVHINSLNIG